MPSKRSSNAQQKRRAKGSGSAGRGRAQRESLAPARGTAANDILGVALIVVSVVMFLSLVTPTSAPVTHALGEFLTLCFGMGAFLCPVALIVFSSTFFVEREGSAGTRVAVGLALVVAAILGILSINVPGAEANPDAVLVAQVAASRGGYVGGAIAWCLLKSVGMTVGNVVLVGVIAAGAIVCGFSLSGAVQRLRERYQAFEARHEAARQQRMAGQAGAYDAYDETLDMAQDPLANQTDAGMAPIAERRTTVFRRNQTGAEDDAKTADDEPEQKTTVLSSAKTKILERKRKKHPPIDEDEAVPAGTVAANAAEGTSAAASAPAAATSAVTAPLPVVPGAKAAAQPAVPDFLRDAKGSGIGRQGSSDSARKAPGEKSRASRSRKAAGAKAASVQTAMPIVPEGESFSPKGAVAAAPKGVKRPGDGVEDYELPPFSMLSSNPNSANSASSKEELDETKERLQGTLHEFGLSSRVVDYVSGPLDRDGRGRARQQDQEPGGRHRPHARGREGAHLRADPRHVVRGYRDPQQPTRQRAPGGRSTVRNGRPAGGGHRPRLRGKARRCGHREDAAHAGGRHHGLGQVRHDQLHGDVASDALHPQAGETHHDRPKARGVQLLQRAAAPVRARRDGPPS